MAATSTSADFVFISEPNREADEVLGFPTGFVGWFRNYRLDEITFHYNVSSEWVDPEQVANHFATVTQWPHMLNPPAHDLDFAIACTEAMNAWQQRVEMYRQYSIASGNTVLSQTMSPECWRRLFGRLNQLAFLFLCDAEVVMKFKFLADHNLIETLSPPAEKELSRLSERIPMIHTAYHTFRKSMLHLWNREKKWAAHARDLDDEAFEFRHC